MATPVVISIDAMGGDAAPRVVVEGLALAARRYGKAARFLLHGREGELAPLLKAHPLAAAASEVRHTDSLVAMTDKPSEAVRRSKGSSMWNAVEAVKRGEAAVAVSAGNTGALMGISKLVLRTMENVYRPAIAASWPTPNGFCVALDVGANVDASAEQLVEFAIMGEAFARAVHKIARPRVGLLNVGAEEGKGHEEVKGADALFRASGLDLDYIGFIEGNDISVGGADVVVTDGFTGNVALKTAEGTARLIGGWVKEAFATNALSGLAAGLLKLSGGVGKLKARLDPANLNGGVFLGLNGVVVKSHGGTDAAGFANAVRIAVEMAQSPFGEEVAASLARFAAARTPAGLADAAPEEAVRAAAQTEAAS